MNLNFVKGILEEPNNAEEVTEDEAVTKKALERKFDIKVASEVLFKLEEASEEVAVTKKASKEANNTKVASEEVLKSDEASEEEVATNKASEEEAATRPLRLNWGPEIVHFGKTHLWDPNINVRI